MSVKRALWVVFSVVTVPCTLNLVAVGVWSTIAGMPPIVALLASCLLAAMGVLYGLLVSLPTVAIVWLLFRPGRHSFMKLGALLGTLFYILAAIYPPYDLPGSGIVAVTPTIFANLLLLVFALGIPVGLFSTAVILALMPHDLEKDAEFAVTA